MKEIKEEMKKLSKHNVMTMNQMSFKPIKPYPEWDQKFKRRTFGKSENKFVEEDNEQFDNDAAFVRTTGNV